MGHVPRLIRVSESNFKFVYVKKDNMIGKIVEQAHAPS